RCHFLGCAVGEVRNGPIFDLASLAVGLTQEDTAVGSAIGSNARRLGDIHNYDNKAIFPQMLGEPEKSSAYKSSSKRAANSRGSPHLCHSLWGEHTIKHIAHACFPIGHEDGIGLMSMQQWEDVSRIIAAVHFGKDVIDFHLVSRHEVSLAFPALTLLVLHEPGYARCEVWTATIAFAPVDPVAVIWTACALDY